MTNADLPTIDGFGEEWAVFDQRNLPEASLLFQQYFSIFPWERLPADARGFDLGCGSGRWARFVSERVAKLYCIDASELALEVARKNLSDRTNCEFYHASVDSIPLHDDSMDFGYSLGVLHHVPDTLAGLRSCVAKLKPNAPLLVYLYYAFDNRPFWFRKIWRITDSFRRVVSRLPFRVKRLVTDAVAAFVYWPTARLVLLLERLGLTERIVDIPLAPYRYRTFYSMRTDALDRFGTRLEQRFTADQIRRMMEECGLVEITVSPREPYWCAVGFKRQEALFRDADSDNSGASSQCT